MTTSRLDLTREQILAFRRTVGALDERLPPGPESLRQAAWAGLQDSMPRAALLSIHARVAGVDSSAWEDPSLVQVWGPRFSAYVVAAQDAAIFTLGRFPVDARGRERAESMASRLHDFLGGRRMTYGEAGHAMGVHPNALRLGTTTGRLLIRWAGARQPLVWTVPPPEISQVDARAELARRYLHVFGPSSSTSFARWAGMKPPGAKAAFEGLADSLVPARTPIGNEWLLASDEAAARAADPAVTGAGVVRLLPSGDTYFLLQDADRHLLVPDARRRALLWTPRVWPGAVLLGGEIVGVWRRADADLTIEPWRKLSSGERGAVEAEAASLPLPALRTPIRVRWAT
jgi:hypothetical protein